MFLPTARCPDFEPTERLPQSREGMFRFGARSLVIQIGGAVDEDAQQFLAYDAGLRLTRISGILRTSVFDKLDALRLDIADAFS